MTGLIRREYLIILKVCHQRVTYDFFIVLEIDEVENIGRWFNIEDWELLFWIGFTKATRHKSGRIPVCKLLSNRIFKGLKDKTLIFSKVGFWYLQDLRASGGNRIIINVFHRISQLAVVKLGLEFKFFEQMELKWDADFNYFLQELVTVARVIYILEQVQNVFSV